MTAPAPPSYRHELDGLRAIAVLAVLGYHAGYNDFAGGFVGVDVFLVLSGYLITQQICTALSQGRFNPGRFWLRRVRRLLPAMLPVLAFTLVSAMLLKGPGAFEEFAGHFLSAGFFYSNYQFLSETDYFARASETNLLLHTWSLSLEWQFYLVMPLILSALHRFGRVILVTGLLLLSAASLATAERLIATGSGNWAFYAITPRFWEFALGGVVALLPRAQHLSLIGPALRGLGLGLIIWMVFGYSGGSFPGLGAGLPVLGTMLVLAAPDSARDPIARMLQWRWMKWLGLRSYAIYLIHWPLMVNATSINMDRPEGTMSVAVVISLFLGHLIYRYVETPVRTGERFKSTAAILRYGALTLIAIALIWTLLPLQPVTALRARLPLLDIRETAGELDEMRNNYMALLDQIDTDSMPGVKMCSFDNINATDAMLACLTATDLPDGVVLVIGDSHGRDVLMALRRVFPDRFFVMLHQSACAPADYERGNSTCFDNLETILTRMVETDDLTRVILAARWWFGEHTHVAETLTMLNRLNVESFVIGPGPTFDVQMQGLALEAGLAGTALRDLAGLAPIRFAFDVRGSSTELAALADDTGFGFFNRYALFCPDDLCPIFDADTGQFLYIDNQHLSRAGMERLILGLQGAPQLAEFLSATAP